MLFVLFKCYISLLGLESVLYGKLHKVAALMISYKRQVALPPCFHFRTTRLSVKIRHDHNSCIGLIASSCWISDLSGYRSAHKRKQQWSTVLFI